MAAAWLSLLLPSTWGDSRGLVRGYDYLAASPNAQDQSARNRRLTTAEGVRELVGDSQREKGRKRQGMERVMDKERENDGLKEEDMAERGTLKRDTHEGFRRRKKDNGREGIGEAEMDARWLKRDDERSRKWTRRG